MHHRLSRRGIVRRLALCCGGLALALHVSARAALSAPHGEGSDLAALAREWRRLRPLKGRFDGAPWSDVVDRWQGPKHQVMQRLADTLVARRAAAAEVRMALGPPDAVLRTGQPAHGRALASLTALQPAGADGREADPGLARAALWVYDWRGRHDRLVLALRRDRVVGCGWLHDWE